MEKDLGPVDVRSGRPPQTEFDPQSGSNRAPLRGFFGALGKKQSVVAIIARYLGVHPR